ncbi:MAG: hypothetical protein HOY79_43955 [Streptomyces sp.]|nr:hypothetical protein [Streptomyces sp.]
MNLDETLAEAMRRAADRLPVNPSPTSQTVHRGLTARRRRRAATTTALALATIGAVAVPGWLAVTGPDPAGPRPQAPATAVSEPRPLRPTARIVEAGERISLRSGAVFWLSAQGLRLALPGTPADQPDSVRVPTGDAAITGIARTTGPTVLWAGIYHGPGNPAAITVTVGGRQLSADVLSLPGSPGWTAFVAEGTDPGAAAAKPTVTAYAADGGELLSSRL